MFAGSLRLGKIAGIAVDIHYSLILIALLLVNNLVVGSFPQDAPGYTDNEYLGFALLTVILFFFSILWHELAHSFVALYFQVKVRRIVLFIMGGVAEIEDEPHNATQEFWIAIVGPLSSLVLGLLFLSGELIYEEGSLLGEMMAWLGLVNIMLAAFNMLPGFPLDGGRVLRAFLWWTTRNHFSATRWTTYSGQAMGYVSIITGIFMLLVIPNPYLRFNGIWGLAMGLFLIFASQHFLRSARQRNQLQGVPIGQIVQSGTHLKPEWPLSYAMDVMVMHGPHSVLPVIQDDQLIGYLALDILRDIRHLNWAGMRVQDAMRSIDSISRVEAGRDLYDMLHDQKLQTERYWLVMLNQNPIGLLSQQEIVNYVQQRTQRAQF
jgi:Zn-dependent protease/predicted transcriptional regulator